MSLKVTQILIILCLCMPAFAATKVVGTKVSLNTSNNHLTVTSSKANEAKPQVKTKKIDPKKRSLANWTQQKQLEALIAKSKNDIRLDGLIEKQLGNKFKRASVYDLYPLEPYTVQFSDEENRKEFIAYYDYARKELVGVSQGPLLRVLHQDYDLDSTKDYAIIVSRAIEYDKKGYAKKPKHKERIYLLVANDTKVLYFQPLGADYLEFINGGNYPTSLAIGKRLYRVDAPAFRVLALDGDSYALYYDKNKSGWVKIYTDGHGDGG